VKVEIVIFSIIMFISFYISFEIYKHYKIKKLIKELGLKYRYNYYWEESGGGQYLSEIRRSIKDVNSVITGANIKLKELQLKFDNLLKYLNLNIIKRNDDDIYYTEEIKKEVIIKEIENDNIVQRKE